MLKRFPQFKQRRQTMNKTLKPAISVNLRKNQIRIHKDTLHSIGNPYYIILLVNPNERTMAVLPSDISDTKAHHISNSALVKKKSFEIYSMSLIQNLRNLCNHWEDNKTYRIYGEKTLSKDFIRFKMAEAISVYEKGKSL